jgi:sugar phosphate isomerase/epimerase
VGYGGVDVNLGRALGEGVDSTRALLKELNLKPSSIGLPLEFRKDDATFQAGLTKLEPAAQFARAIGCPRMVTYVMSSSDTPKAELRQTLHERFQACAAVLARSEVRLGLEFLGPLHIRKRLPHEFIWRMDEMLEFAKQCGPNVGLLLDSWHWHHAGATPKDILAAGKSRIVHVHLADAPDLPPEKILDNERLMPGDGVIDWNGFLGALRKIGYEDGLSPEIFGKFLKEMTPEEAARRALNGSLAVMRKAGVA